MPAREPIAILETDIARLERIGKCGHLGTFRSPDLWRLLRREGKTETNRPSETCAFARNWKVPSVSRPELSRARVLRPVKNRVAKFRMILHGPRLSLAQRQLFSASDSFSRAATAFLAQRQLFSH